jgi:hypothetical protein
MPEIKRSEADIRKEMPLYIARFYDPVSRMRNSPLKTGRFETRFNCAKQHTVQNSTQAQYLSNFSRSAPQNR